MISKSNDAHDGDAARRRIAPDRGVVRASGHRPLKRRFFHSLGSRGNAQADSEARVRRMIIIVIALMLASWGLLLIAASGLQIF